MAERDRAAVDVDLVAVEAQLLLDRQVLRRERLVDLEEVDVVERQARASQRLRVAGAGPMPMYADRRRRRPRPRAARRA